MSAWREQMTDRIKEMVKRGFIPEKDITDDKGNLKPEAVFDKVIGLGREFMGMVGEFAKNQPATAPLQRVPVSIPTTGPVPAPAPGPATPTSTAAPPPLTQSPPRAVEIPPTITTSFPERNGMEIIGVKVKATAPRQ